MINLKGRTRNLLLIAGTALLGFIFWYFSTIVTYILISLVLSFIGRPIVRRLSLLRYRNLRIPRVISALIALMALWVFFISLFRFLIPLIIKEFTILSNIDFDAVFGQIQEPINDLIRFTSRDPVRIDNQSFFELIVDQISEKLNITEISTTLGFVVGILGETVIGFFAVSFITFFFLKDEKMFREGILLLVPSEFEEKTAKILDSVSALLRRYFIGLIFEVVMVGLLVTLGITLAGLEFQHAVLIGLICGLFNVIPYVGPWMGAAMGIIIGIAVNSHMNFNEYTLPLLGWMVLVFLTVQIIDNVLFQPLIYSSSVKAHPLEIFLVILAAGSMAGILGMILAIPVYTILRVIAREFFENMKLVKKITQNLSNT